MNNKLTVLIVEDENAISNFIATILTANGYRALKAEKGNEALAVISSHCPDVILLDLGLPDMDGLRFCVRYGSGHRSRSSWFQPADMNGKRYRRWI
jgi:DNA-binding response OmpR family regulator